MNPFTFFSISRRQLFPGENYSPVVPIHQLVPTGPGPQGYTEEGKPCGIDGAYYIVHPAGMAFPGYHIVAGWDEQGNLLHFDAPRPKPQVCFSPGPSHPPFLSTPSSPFLTGVANPPNAPILQNEGLPVYIIIRGHDGFYVQPPKSLRFHRATNFLINLIAIKHTLQSGQDETRSILFDVDIPSQVHCSLEIPSTRLKYILTDVLDQVCEARILRGGNLGAFEPELQDLLRQEILLCPHLYEIRESGWFVSPSGCYFFAEDSALPPDSTLCFRTGFSFLRGEQ